MNRNRNLLFAHYTSAEAAMKILDGENIWLRNSRCMNDTQEIEGGLARLQKDVLGGGGKNFRSFLNSKFDRFWKKSEVEITELFEKFRHETYFLSVSEHPKDEQELGRLSMWRAYGGGSPVALILKKDVFLRKVEDPASNVIPVEYHIEDNKKKGEPKYLTDLMSSMEKNREYLRGLDPKIILKNLVNLAIQIAFGTKHSGFREEREWRVAYNPHRPSSQITMTRQTISQVPQKVGVIDFAKIPNDRGGEGVEISDLLERIIIGPMEHPNVVKNAFVDYLLGGREKPPQDDIDKAEAMVIVSDIPLRC